MGTTFINISGNGFWIQDGILEVWLRLAVLHVEDPAADDSPLHALRSQWLLASRGIFSGWSPFDLQGNIATAVGRTATVSAFQSLLAALRAAPPTLDPAALNLLGMDGAFQQPLFTSQLIEVGTALLELLDGKRFGTAAQAAFMPGNRPPDR